MFIKKVMAVPFNGEAELFACCGQVREWVCQEKISAIRCERFELCEEIECARSTVERVACKRLCEVREYHALDVMGNGVE